MRRPSVGKILSRSVQPAVILFGLAVTASVRPHDGGEILFEACALMLFALAFTFMLILNVVRLFIETEAGDKAGYVSMWGGPVGKPPRPQKQK